MASQSIDFTEEICKIQKTLDRPLNHKDIASLVGFSEEELIWIDRFWGPTFNNEWLYLSYEVVTEWIGYSKNKNSLSDFSRKIKPNLIEDIDYKIVSKDHHLVKSCSEAQLSKIDDEKRGGSNKKYYIINGQTLKICLMMANTEVSKSVRKYYIKVETLASIMSQYIISESNKKIAMLEKLAEVKDTKIDELMKKIDDQNSMILEQKSMILKQNSMITGQSLRMDKLLDYAEETHETLVDTQDTLNETKKEVQNVSSKLGKVRNEAVVPHVELRRHEVCCVYQNPDEPKKFKVIRCQKCNLPRSIQISIKKGYTKEIFRVENPNAINLWSRARNDFPETLGTIEGGVFITLEKDQDSLISFLKEKEAEKHLLGD